MPASTVPSLPTAPLTAPASPASGVTVQLTQIRAITTEALLPGEIAGPGLAITLRIDNAGSGSIDLDNAIVDLRGANGARGIAVSGSPAAPLSGSLAPGDIATGVYVFTIPDDQRNPVSVLFSYSAQTPTVILAGDAR